MQKSSNPPEYTADGVVYVRYSSHAQRDVSIEQQTRVCQAFAKRQGIRIVQIYEDRALTGTSDKRPGFQSMIADAKKGGWQYVIVYTLDRFARDRYDSAVYKRQLKNAGVKVLSAMENISDDPIGILMESLLEGLAEYYSKELSVKVRRGHEDNARKCLVNGVLPLGYVKGPDGKYQIQEQEATVVLEIFHRVADGESHADIRRDLNRRGITTKLGRSWTRSSFGSLLQNERYAGVYLYNDIRIPGGVPRIVPQELFDAVQLTLHLKPNARKDPTGTIPQKRRRDNSVYLLTGKLFCGHCESPMIGVSGTSHTDTPHHYYTCKGRREDHASCAKRNVRRDDIEQFVAAALRDTMFTPKAMAALAVAAVDYQSRHSNRNELLSLKNRLSDTARALNNLVSAIEAGIFTPTTQARMVELEAQKRDLERLISVTAAEVDGQLTKEEIITTLELFKDGDVQDKNYQEALIDTFLIAAYIYDDKVRFVFNLGDHKTKADLPFNPTQLDPSAVRIEPGESDQKSGDRVRGHRIFKNPMWSIRNGANGACSDALFFMCRCRDFPP